MVLLHCKGLFTRSGAVFSDLLIHELTLLPTGGGGGGAFIRLAARTLELFYLESPKFLTSFLCPLDTLWRNFRSIDLSWGLLQSFWNKRSSKIRDMNILVLFKMAENCRGVQFGVGKTIAGHRSLILYQ